MGKKEKAANWRKQADELEATSNELQAQQATLQSEFNNLVRKKEEVLEEERTWP